VKHPAPLAIILLAVAMLFISGCAVDDSPRRSLAALKAALVDHDADNAIKYLDIDSVVASFVDDLLLKGEASASRRIDSMGLKMARGVASLARPAMNAFVEHQLRAAIMSDDQWGYVDDIRRTRMWYYKIAEESDTAIVEPRGKAGFYLVMKQASPGLWKIAQIKAK
jgi:hypothetical protein